MEKLTVSIKITYSFAQRAKFRQIRVVKLGAPDIGADIYSTFKAANISNYTQPYIDYGIEIACVLCARTRHKGLPGILYGLIAGATTSRTFKRISDNLLSARRIRLHICTLETTAIDLSNGFKRFVEKFTSLFI